MLLCRTWSGQAGARRSSSDCTAAPATRRSGRRADAGRARAPGGDVVRQQAAAFKRLPARVLWKLSAAEVEALHARGEPGVGDNTKAPRGLACQGYGRALGSSPAACAGLPRSRERVRACLDGGLGDGVLQVLHLVCAAAWGAGLDRQARNMLSLQR